MQEGRQIKVSVNNNQIRGYIDVLKNMDNALFARTKFFPPIFQSSYIPKKIKASDKGAAAIHFVLPSDVSLDPLILSEAANANVKVYTSKLEFRRITHLGAKERQEYRVSKPVCENCTTLKSANDFLTIWYITHRKYNLWTMAR